MEALWKRSDLVRTLPAMAADGQPRTYTGAEREEALRLYRDLGPAETGRQLDIPAGTVRQWALRAGLTDSRHATARAGTAAARQTWAQRRAEMTVRLGEIAAEFLERAIKASKSRDSINYMGSASRAIDRAQLLDGGATGRLEVSEPEARAEVRRMRDELAARREQKRAAGAAE
jgi:hypothetical protein